MADPTAFLPRRRGMLAAGCAALLAGCAARLPGTAAAPAPRLLGTATLRHGLRFAGTTVGGLSGIDYDPATGLYALVSDDRSEHGPARIYTARIGIDAAGGAVSVELQSAIPLLRGDGQPGASARAAGAGDEVLDPEAVRWRATPRGPVLLWTTEGDFARGFGPALRESAPDGTLLRTFGLPAMFAPDRAGRRGPRDNKGFEGLALTPDGRHAWLAMEGALVQDGPLPAVGVPGGPCRLTCVDLQSGRALRQIAYMPDAVPHAPVLPGGMADNGISEVLMLDAHAMLVLERSYALGRGVSLRLYRIDTREAGDVLGVDALAPGNHRPAAKTLVADFATLGLPQIDNTEGLCWGPPLPDGRRTLLAVSDDNFNLGQVTQIAAFALAD
ncbi:esterase-like activity of phytase family protein [Ramlibacter sp. H39-3-26]|uniref:esterase-like activity of phytase family protein n=1 Tax=Curvibacter soli TaxID=3031331 RepID=UPI0023DC1624|nr:esterase-like activity of phytase family protein [Ramlibacter sp. H39-3-26]MDF1484973.1 esterase-like activity of phytase family protein [Ramlibacter sp. H39-3-26]